MFSQRKPTRKAPAKLNNPGEQNALIQHIRQTFTPGAPIDDPAMFAARRDEIMRLHNFVQTPGEVAFIFGERGVGKTSLAKHTAAKFSKEFNWKEPLFKSCDPDDEFATLLAQPLKEVGVDPRSRLTRRPDCLSGVADRYCRDNATLEVMQCASSSV